MIERFLYYAQAFSELCGFDGSEGGFVFGWFMVVLATVIVIASFYICITRMLWPGEEDQDHIKRRILIDDQAPYEN